MMKKYLTDIFTQNFITMLKKIENINDNDFAIIEIEKNQLNDYMKEVPKIFAKTELFHQKYAKEKKNQEESLTKKDKEISISNNDSYILNSPNKNKDNESNLIIKINILVDKKDERRNEIRNDSSAPQKYQSLENKIIFLNKKNNSKNTIATESIDSKKITEKAEGPNINSIENHKKLSDFPKDKIVPYQEKAIININSYIQKSYISTPSPEDSLQKFNKDLCIPIYIKFKKDSYNRWKDQLPYINELNENIKIKKNELSLFHYDEVTFCKETIRYTINKKIHLFLNDASQKYRLNSCDLIDSIFPKWYIANINEIFFDDISFKKWCYGKTSNNMNKIKYYLNSIKEIQLRCWVLKKELKNSCKYANINDLVAIFIHENMFNDLLESIKYLLYNKK